VNARRLEARAWYESLKPRELEGHEVTLLEGGREFFPALIAELDGARGEVFVETYLFEDDAAGREVAASIAHAARRGVRVRVTVDGYGTPRLRGMVGEMLRGAGVEVETFRPERRALSLDRARLRRMHRKLAVIDGRVAFVGGINLLDDLRDPNHGPLAQPRVDFAVRVRGPIVANAHLAVQRLWWELSVVHRPLVAMREARASWGRLASELVSDVTPAGRMRASLVLRDNFRFRRAIEREYLRAIGRAHREVLIANAYFLPGRRFRRALVAAARRGVRVRLLLQGRIEYLLPHYATQALYDELLREGIEIVEYRRSFLHAKVAVIDDRATVGSSNIDPFSLLLAREANVFVNDAGFADELRRRIERLIADGGDALQLVRHRRRPLLVRLFNRVALLMLRIAIAISGRGAQY